MPFSYLLEQLNQRTLTQHHPLFLDQLQSDPQITHLRKHILLITLIQIILTIDIKDIPKIFQILLIFEAYQFVDELDRVEVVDFLVV